MTRKFVLNIHVCHSAGDNDYPVLVVLETQTKERTKDTNWRHELKKQQEEGFIPLTCILLKVFWRISCNSKWRTEEQNEVKDESDGCMFWHRFLMFFVSQCCQSMCFWCFLSFLSRNPLSLSLSLLMQEEHSRNNKKSHKDMQEKEPKRTRDCQAKRNTKQASPGKIMPSKVSGSSSSFLFFLSWVHPSVHRQSVYVECVLVATCLAEKKERMSMTQQHWVERTKLPGSTWRWHKDQHRTSVISTHVEKGIFLRSKKRNTDKTINMTW